MDFHFGLHGVDVADFIRIAHRDIEGSGTVEGAVRITGTPQSPFVDGDVTVAGLRYGDLKLESLFGEITYAGSDLETFFEAKQAERRVLSGGGHAPLDLRFMRVAERKLDRPLAMSFIADSLPLGLPLGALAGFTDVTGRLDGSISAAGTSLDPVLSGSIDVRDGAASWAASGVHYYGVNGTAKLVSDRAFDILASGRSATGRRTARALSLVSGGEDGTATVSGRLDFAALTDPTFDLKLNAANLLAVKRREADITMTGDMQLRGHYTRPELTGEVTVDEGSLYLDEVYKRYLVVELDPNLLFNVIDTSLVSVRRLLPVSDNPFLNNLLITNAVVHVSPGDAWLRSEDLDVLVGGDIQVEFDRRAADLRMTGVLAVERGTYQLAYPPLQARRFQVREGTIEFPGTPGIDPNLSITAAYRAPTKSEPLDILAIVSGSLQTPRVRLTSDAEPPISESDLASYLFFGVPSWEVASFRNGTSGLNADFGLRTFAPSVLGYAASGLQTLGQRFGLLDYVGITAAEAVPGQADLNNAFANFFASTQIDLGAYVLPNVYLGVTKRLTGSAGARVEWRYSPTYTAQVFWEDRFANTPSFGLQREAGLRRVGGFFLFREWGY
jgi:autotransporter translocation and assembly factor TamB